MPDNESIRPASPGRVKTSPRRISRREALKTLAGISAGAAILPAIALEALAAPAEQPNILYVFADQMGAPFMGCAGMPEVRKKYAQIPGQGPPKSRQRAAPQPPKGG
jgi:hypothetical protein